MDSKLLLRTNPQLTGNIKICINSSDQLYLNSMPVSATLSQSYYQKKKISANSNYSNDISNFFTPNNTPTEAIFTPGRVLSDMIISPNQQSQYEKQYEYGFSRNNNGLYSEQFSVFAPLYIGTDGVIPSKFVIFRMANPLPYQPLISSGSPLTIGSSYIVYGTGTITHNYVKYTNGNSFVALNTSFTSIGGAMLYLDDPAAEYAMLTSRSLLYDQMVDKSQIACVYDLSANASNIGKYLNNHVTDVMYNDNFINVNFNTGTIVYSGIDIDSGVISNIEENMSPLTQADMDILLFDEYVTAGWQRNRMISHRILNLEFLFDDTSVPDYSFYRYFGLYVNDTDFANFNLKSSNWLVTPSYKNPYISDPKIPYGYNKQIVDPDGIKIQPDGIDINYSGHVDYELISNINMLCYVKDANDIIHKIQNSKCTQDTLCLLDTYIDFNELFGFTNQIEEKVNRTTTAGCASNCLTVSGVIPTGTIINLVNGNGSLVASIRADTLSGVASGYGPGQNYDFYFYPSGSVQQIASAISMALRSVTEGQLIQIDAIENSVYLKFQETGYKNNSFSLEIIGISTTSQNNISQYSQNFSGGTDYANNRTTVLTTSLDDISSSSYINCEDGYGIIKDVALYLDEPVINDEGNVTSYNNVNNYRTYTLTEASQAIKINSSNQITINRIQQLKYGVFDIAPIGDFDYAMQTSDYSKTYSNEYYKYYHSTSLKTGDVYTIFKLQSDPNNAIISHGGEIYTNSGTSISFVASSTSFVVVSGNPIVVNNKYIYDEELINFIGFNSISRLQNQNLSLSGTDDITNKETIIDDNNNLTEYDRLFENVKSYLSLKSKIVPYINKWSIDGGDDVRGNPYRLNLSLAFGEMNFTPSQFDDTQNPLYFTHEWFYLGGVPELMSDQSLKDSTSYLFKPFDRELAINQDFDYFVDYFENDFNYKFNITGDTPPTSPDDYQQGYVVINRPVSQKYSVFQPFTNNTFTTFFRGVKINIAPTGSIDYSGYKFAAVINFVNTIDLQVQKPVSIELIENTNFKTITMLMQIVIDDYKVYTDYYNNYSNTNNVTFTEYLYLYAMNSIKEYNPSLLSSFLSGDINSTYDYGIEFYYPMKSATGITLKEADGTSTITTFRGIQFYNQLDYSEYTGQANVMNFIGYVDGVLLSDELKLTADQTYGRLIGIDAYDFLAVTSLNGYISSSSMIVQNISTISTISTISDKVVTLETPPPQGLFAISVPGLTAGVNVNPVSLDAIYPLSGVVWFAEGGGQNIYQASAKYSSFSSVYTNINNDSFITHTTASDGMTTVGNGFTMNIVQPDQISVGSYATAQQIMTEYPAQLPNIPVYDYVNSIVNSSTTFYRYSGNYAPIIKNVVQFGSYKDTLRWSNCDSSWSDMLNTWDGMNLEVTLVDYIDGQWIESVVPFYDTAINNSYVNMPLYKTNRDINACLLLDIDDSGVIPEYYYHKISSLPIISLIQNPVYPAIGEICIDFKNNFIFEPSLSPLYFRQYTDKLTYISMPGEASLYEDKAFFNGKCLKVPDTIVISNPAYINDNTITPTSVLTDDNIHYYVDSNNILYMAFRHISILSDTIYNNSATQFSSFFRYFKFGDPATLAKQYITNNILPDFGSPTINVYLRDNPANATSLVTYPNNMTNLQLIKANYADNNSFNIIKTSTQVFMSTQLKTGHRYDMILDLEFTLGAS